KRYRDRVKAAQQKTGLGDAVVCGLGRVGGLPTVLCAFEFGFMGGSMGSVVGEKLARAIELAVAKHVPVIIVAASGGARMPEGFQRSEFLLEHGQVDLVVDRRDLKETLRRLLTFFADAPPPTP